ncbi:MAG: histidine phosphatase family protein [Dehalococcoidia bacterium]
MRLILVRHGETDANREGRVQGAGNARLNATGRSQASALGRRLASYDLEAVYSSPQSRALETAEAIAQHHGLPVTTLEGLREMDLGELDGLRGEELRNRYPDFMKEWDRNISSLRMPGGESVAELQVRAWASIESIAERHPQGVVVAVSHNFAIQSVLCKALGLALDSFRKIRHDLGAISILELGEGTPVLVTMNDRCHRDEGE